MQNKVLITDGLTKEGIGLLKLHFKILTKKPKKTDDVSALIIKTATKVDQKLLQEFKNLQAICRVGIGVDHIDLKACKAKGIAVMNTPNGNRIATAEHTLGLIFALAKKIVSAHENLKNKKWDRALFKGLELSGKTLGIIGLGRIGREVAKRAQALGMNVIACDPYLNPQIASGMNIPLMSHQELVAKSDFVTLHVPLTDETHHMVNQKLLKFFKKQSFLVNASRGAVVKEADLLAALNKGILQGAALDVFEQEPLARNSKLRLNKQVVLTPHIAGQSIESEKRLALEAAENIITYFREGQCQGLLL